MTREKKDVLRVDLLSFAFVFSGGVFLAAGTIGLWRFPDIFTRLHALTKADNLGLGLVVWGLVLQADSWHIAVKLSLIWLLVMVASATACHLIARMALRGGYEPWRKS
jgi:multicomponent Na+:H+ antiporter subunit G